MNGSATRQVREPTAADEIDAFLTACSMVYGNEPAPADAMGSFTMGWHCALAWITAEMLKARRDGVELRLRVPQ